MSERVKVEKDEDMIGRKRESLKLEYAVYARRNESPCGVRARARVCVYAKEDVNVSTMVLTGTSNRN